MSSLTVREAFWRWFWIGLISAAVLLGFQALSVGGPAGLLQVGETSNLRPLIEDQLGEVPLAAGRGHDGQIFYAIGLDLSGQDLEGTIRDAGFRYRRILYPALASAGGLLDGWGLLYGMIGVALLSSALACGFVAAMATRSGTTNWFGLVVVLNPGIWLSVRLLTADLPAVAMIVGALFFVRSRQWTGAGLAALGVMTKEVHLATFLGPGFSRDRRNRMLLVAPLVALTTVVVWVSLTLGDGLAGGDNLSFPLVGIVDAVPNWESFGSRQWFYLVFALGSVGVGLVFTILHRGSMRWSLLAWSLLGLSMSSWVWNASNNAARALAPIAILVVLSHLEQIEANQAAGQSALS